MKINITGDLAALDGRPITELATGDIFTIPPFNDEVYIKAVDASPGVHVQTGLAPYVTLEDGKIVTGKDWADFLVIQLKPVTISDGAINLIPA
jgi:hypothetical protein